MAPNSTAELFADLAKASAAAQSKTEALARNLVPHSEGITLRPNRPLPFAILSSTEDVGSRTKGAESGTWERMRGRGGDHQGSRAAGGRSAYDADHGRASSTKAVDTHGHSQAPTASSSRIEGA
ncbi:hypothetical protein C8R44DRAFT_738859 [Mycena epipterygia]|nr:hypothetical protein C8R44DRAFT_738859 [Mycena epipterygia]